MLFVAAAGNGEGDAEELRLLAEDLSGVEPPATEAEAGAARLAGEGGSHLNYRC